MIWLYLIIAILIILLIVRWKQRSAQAADKSKAVFARVTARGFSIEGIISVMNLRDDEEVVVTLEAKDAAGAVATLTEIAFTSSDPGVVVTQDPTNPATAKITAAAGVVA